MQAAQAGRVDVGQGERAWSGRLNNLFMEGKKSTHRIVNNNKDMLCNIRKGGHANSFCLTANRKSAKI
jgi:hypothetical protein